MTPVEEFLEKERELKENTPIVIGGSAGSIPVLFNMAHQFPEDFRHPIVVVVHRGYSGESMLKEILQKKSRLAVSEVEPFNVLSHGIFLAPADYHLLVDQSGRLELDYSEKVLYSRPSIDVSFISFANAFKNKLIAVMLSGANSDGAIGAHYIKKMGGRLVVQSPNDAESGIMPTETLKITPNADAIVPANQIVNTLIQLVNNGEYARGV